MPGSEVTHADKHAPLPQASVSSFAPALRAVRPDLRSRLGIDAESILIWDVLISGVALLIDDHDKRPVDEKIDSLIESHFPDGVTDDEVSLYVDKVSEVGGEGLPEWLRKLQHAGGKRFLRRLLGAAEFDRLEVAFKHDIAVIALGLRRGLRAVMPYASALDSTWALLSDKQKQEFANLGTVETIFLQVALQVDDALERILDAEVLKALLDLRASDLESLGVTDFAVLASNMREVVAGRAKEAATGLGATIARKVDGAKAALQYSPDAVSQAANSLVELVDRLLRAGFSDEVVLSWADTYYSDWKGLTYLKDGKRMPTKKAQSLCFVYAGKPASDRVVINEMVAVSLKEARDRLQALKHADSGDEGQREEVAEVMAAIDGFLHYIIGFSWSRTSADELQRLRDSLS